MFEVVQAHTADLAVNELIEIRQLLTDAYDGRLKDADWEHALGGMHILLRDRDELVGHAAVVQRRLYTQELVLRAGYIEAVAVRADRRRQHGATQLMGVAEQVIRASYDLGALRAHANSPGFCCGRGWQPWQGATFTLTPAGLERTPEDDDYLMVLLTADSSSLVLDESIACDGRPGDAW